MKQMDLYAICWQDTHEPWGWAPATEEHDQLPHGPFFWDLRDAEDALRPILDAAVVETFEDLRLGEDRRHKEEVERFEAEKERGGPGMGVSVTIVGQPRQPWAPTPPRPRREEATLRNSARRIVESEWSIQTYRVPVPKT